MLLPALGKARDQANRAACMSNMRQLATAWINYCGDYTIWVTCAYGRGRRIRNKSAPSLNTRDAQHECASTPSIR